MNQKKFKELNLSSEIQRAIDEAGFEFVTEIQSKAIPVIINREDVIGKSQTGTGKTLAFGIPAVETVNSDIKNVQVLVICPTRELVLQVCEELHRITKFKHSIKIADVYGGAPIERQILKLKKASIVVGTPGRIMDHMRRRTLKLNNLKMVVLDEADEMLSMGFREDIETILDQTNQDRQTVLFSATMSPEILLITRKYQNNPKIIEVNGKKATVDKITQIYYDVPMNKKMDALNLILRFHSPKLAMVFCNTKKMVDEIIEYLSCNDFNVEGIHGDMKQSQRTKVMNSFKTANTNILVATDVAARGIDVNDIDFVINYDIPQNTEYYIHRIGRTGRAGKSGTAITICSGRQQVNVLTRIGKLVKSEITYNPIPNAEDVIEKFHSQQVIEIESLVESTKYLHKLSVVDQLVSKGLDPKIIAAAVLEKYCKDPFIKDIKTTSKNLPPKINQSYKKIVINVGSSKRIAPSHIVGAITGYTSLTGKDIGKIEIRNDKTIVSVPSHNINSTVDEMKNCRIRGYLVVTKAYKSSKKKFG